MKNKKRLIITTTLVLFVAVALTQVIITANRESETDEPVPVELINKEGEDQQKAEQYQKTLVEKNPLVADLPHYSDAFEVYYGIGDAETYGVVYKIVLLPQSNPENTENYTAEISSLRGIALTWIRSKEVDPDTLDIEWTTR